MDVEAAPAGRAAALGERAESAQRAQVHRRRARRGQDATAFVASVCLFAYVGVLSRVWLSDLTTSIAGAAGPGASVLAALDSEHDLGEGFFLPNIVGVITMGVLSHWSARLQRHWPVLYVGLSTGFCGCCTTFATFVSYLNSKIIAGDAATAVIIAVVHLALCFQALRFGHHLGAAMQQSCCRPRAPLARQTSSEVSEARELGNAYLAKLHAASVAALRRRRTAQASTPLLGTVEEAGEEGGEGDEAGRAAGAVGRLSTRSAHDDGGAVGQEGEWVEPVARAGERVNQLFSNLTAVARQLDLAVEEQSAAADEVDGGFEEAADLGKEGAAALAAAKKRANEYASQLRSLYRAMYVLLLVSTAAFWTLGFLDTNSTRQAWWLKAALGPFGATFRYLTSLYNKRPFELPCCCRGRWLDVSSLNFPLFTFMVNVLATSIASSMADVVISDGKAVPAALSLWEGAINTGFCGSLSTVSTFIAETAGMKRGFHAYRYVLTSIIVAEIMAYAIVNGYITASGNHP